MIELLPKFYQCKHIPFDLWPTLIKSNPEFKPKRNLLFKDFFSINKPIEEVASAIRKFDILTNSVNEKGGRNFDTFKIDYLILDALSIDIEKVSAINLQEYLTTRLRLNALFMLENIREHYQYSIFITNLARAFGNQKIKADGVYNPYLFNRHVTAASSYTSTNFN